MPQAASITSAPKPARIARENNGCFSMMTSF
jgi:hypothetical protein